MALPASGQLGDAASTTVEFQTRIEALRDEVALLMSEMDSAESTLTSLQSQITSNDGDISSIISTLASKANASGTYASLRAQATTKDDVGLGNLPNAISAAWTLDSNSYLATSKAVYSVASVSPWFTSWNGIGSIVLCYHTTVNQIITAGSSYSGSVLRPYGISIGGDGAQDSWAYGAEVGGSALSGTWRALGHINPRNDRHPTTLFIRIS